MTNYKNKKIAVIGLSERTGLAVTIKMHDLGAHIIVSDVKRAEQLKPQLGILNKYKNITYDLGGHSDKILDVDLIVLSPGVPSDIEIIKRAENKGIEIISEVELAFRLTNAKIIGITGTNGKTTVTSLTGHILKENLDCSVKTAGNIGKPLISEIHGLTADDWVVVELSSFQLEKINNFKPNISIFTNFSPDHLDRHKNIDNYWKAKTNIYKNQTKEDTAIINYDDEYLINIDKKIKAKLFKVSNKNNITNGIYYDKEWIYHIKNNFKEKVINKTDIPLIGEHNILNTGFAVMVAKLFDITNQKIVNSVKSYEAYSHRLEVIYDKEYKIIDDSKATNPHAAINALRSLEMPLILIAGGQNREAKFSSLAYTINERVKKAIILGETRYLIKKELDNLGYKDYVIVDNMKEAVQKAFNFINVDDTLLLSPGCPSWDMYESYKKRGKDFQKEVKNIFKG
ncbi:MAG: UDP-N-acetylmuramoyl-L-alanine--D-glutamate ligase [Bacillota bacterium]